MEIIFKKVKIPTFSLMCEIVFIFVLFFAIKRVYYTEVLPVHLLYIGENNIICSSSSENVKYLTDGTYCNIYMFVNNSEIPIDNLKYRKINSDSIQLYINISSVSKRNYDLRTDKKSTLVITKSLYDYLYFNIIGRK